MIEINRGLYMDEQTGRKLPGFGSLKAQVVAIIERLKSEFKEMPYP